MHCVLQRLAFTSAISAHTQTGTRTQTHTHTRYTAHLTLMIGQDILYVPEGKKESRPMTLSRTAQPGH